MVLKKQIGQEPKQLNKDEMAEVITKAAQTTKATDLALLKVTDISSVTDYFFFCSGSSTRQVAAIASNMQREVKTLGGSRPIGLEGLPEGQWVLMDYGDVIVHIFYEPVRKEYDLEGLWGEAKRIEIKQED